MLKDWNERKAIYIGWLLKRIGLILFDLVAVNISYFGILLLRFFGDGVFSDSASKFINRFYQIAPWYSVACIAVFLLFRLYTSVWRYAGLNDLNRIILANGATVVFQLAISLIFVGRMPISYYILGAAVQLFLTGFARFALRLFYMESEKIAGLKQKKGVNALVVGAGGTGRMVCKRLENEKNAVARPVCILDVHGMPKGSLIEGIPVTTGIDRMEDLVKRHSISCVILADPILSREDQDEITGICEKLNLPIRDFSVAGMDSAASVGFQPLMETVCCPVDILLDGRKREFRDAESAVVSLREKFFVRRTEVVNGRLTVTLARDAERINNTDEAWVKDYTETTGQEISFF